MGSPLASSHQLRRCPSFPLSAQHFPSRPPLLLAARLAGSGDVASRVGRVAAFGELLAGSGGEGGSLARDVPEFVVKVSSAASGAGGTTSGPLSVRAHKFAGCVS